ncbi:MAG TPA: WS/DGAT domain-containing protein, partial [Erythrobacter sp.]|nr:WS/DGAT domain-containing protein [Erythrobacter sp.]
EISKVSPALFMALGAQLYTRLGLANRTMAPPFSTVVTNVPGPPVPIYSSGARLESMMGLLCLTDGMGVGHVVQSYCDEATVSFTACRELMPDPEFYVQCIEDSFAELLAAAKALDAKPAAPAKPAATKGKPRKPSAKAAAKPAAAKPKSKPPAKRKTATRKAKKP